MATFLPYFVLGAALGVIIATLWLRFAIVTLNQDMRQILARQGMIANDLAVAFEVTTVSIGKLEKRVKELEDEVL